MSEHSGRSLIAGQAGSDGGRSFHALDPRSGAEIGRPFASATAADVDAAAGAALTAFRELRSRHHHWPAELLERAAELLESKAGEIVAAADGETALGPTRLHGELQRTVGQMRLFATAVRAEALLDRRVDHAGGTRIVSMRVPLGPVAVFGPANFPLAFAVAGGDTASAFAAGCPVIVKAHPAHPATSEIAGRAISTAVGELGLPAGTFSLLFDSGQDVARALVCHPAIRAVGFTGSRGGGLALARLCAERSEPIPFWGELSALNPVVATAAACRERGEQIGRQVADSVVLGVGQFCTRPGLLVCPAGSSGGAVVRSLVDALAAAPPGVMLTPHVRSAYRAACTRLGSSAPTLLDMVETDGRVGAAAWEVTAAAAVDLLDAATDVFGPAILVIRHGGEPALRRVIDALPGQLTATVFGGAGEDVEAVDILPLLAERAGRVIVDGVPTGVAVVDGMVHGGPFPATADGRSTSVGLRAAERFSRPIAYQGVPDHLLPAPLRALRVEATAR